MNEKFYLEECLKKRLIPFLEEYHKKRKIVFWPDLATCHYQKDVIQWMNCQNFEFVKKGENAPNVPQVRLIEGYWAECKKELKDRKSLPKNLNGFKRIWSNISKYVANKCAQNLMQGLKRKLRAVANGQVLEPYKLNDK
jgi:hypothetical protein